MSIIQLRRRCDCCGRGVRPEKLSTLADWYGRVINVCSTCLPRMTGWVKLPRPKAWVRARTGWKA